MMKLGAVVLLAACGGPSHPEAHVAGNNSSASRLLIEAVESHDVARIASYLDAPLSYGGLYFADPDCARQFPTQRKVPAAQLPAFAACLATLPLKASARGHTLADVDVLQYEPGIEAELQFSTRSDHAWITYIGYAGRADTRDALPTITGDALEKLRIDGTRNVEPDAATRAILEAGARDAKLTYQFSWLKICLDATGAVTGAHAREGTSPLASKTFSDAANAWHFHPFEVAGNGVPVCAMERVSYPPTTEPEMLPIAIPLAPGEPATISAHAVKRIAGERLISPDNQDKATISKARVSKVVAAFKVCFDGAGIVQTVAQLVPSGLPGYDAKLIAGMKVWRYEPILDGGKPVAACTGVVFIYSQR